MHDRRMIRGLLLVAASVSSGGLALAEEPVQSLDLTAEQIVADGEKIRAQGDVMLQRGQTVLSGGCLDYDRSSGWITADQELLLDRPDVTVAAPKGRYHTTEHIGTVEQASGAFHSANDIYFKVDHLDLGQQAWVLKNPWVTTCNPGDPVWALRASSAVIDPNQSMTLHDIRFELEGVPVAYLPWLRTTLRERDSGVLFPLFSSGSRRGTEIAWPLYWAANPWLDITYTPHWMSLLGWGHEGEVRIAQPGEGILLLRGFSIRENGADRSLKGWEQTIRGEGWHWRTRGEVLSDEGMASDFVLPLQRDATGRYALQTATFSANGVWGSGSLFVTHRQDLTTSNQGAVVSDGGLAWSKLGTFEAAELDWSLGLGQRRWYAPQGVDLSRWQMIPRVAQSWSDAGITAKWQAQSWLGYYRERSGRVLRQAIPAVSLDLTSGVERVFRRDDGEGWNRFRHRLQPRMQAVWIPYSDQSAIPSQESGSWTLDWSNLWALNRYAGEDRINGARRLTFGVSQSFDGGYGPTEERRIQRWVFMEIARSYEADPKKVLSDAVGVIDQWSPWFARVVVGLPSGWSLRGDIRWDKSTVVDRHRALQWNGDWGQTRLSESWVPGVKHAWVWSGSAQLPLGNIKAKYEWEPNGAGFLGSGIAWRGEFGCWAVGAVVERLRLLDGGEDRRIGFGLTLLGLGGGGELPDLSTW